MAVYTHLTETQIARHLLAHYGLTLTSFSGIEQGVENTNYRVETRAGAFVLTLFETRRPINDIPFCLAFMAHMSKAGIPCARVMVTATGETLVTLAGRASALFSFLDGESRAIPSVSDVAAVGAVLARMHLAAAGFAPVRDNPVGWPQWRDLIEKSLPAASADFPGLAELLRDELEFQRAAVPTGLPAGAVHADLFPDNVFFSDGAVTGVIDFYFSCTEAFAYDLMITANAWCYPDGAKWRAFLEAYQSVRPLSGEERAALGFFARRAALRIVATRLYDWAHRDPHATVKTKDPQEHAAILRSAREGRWPG